MFIPDVLLNSVCDITPDWLSQRGLRGLLLDLDNTLAHYREDKAPPQIEAWIGEMQAANVRLLVCSNSKELRVKGFCDPLGLPYVHTAQKPSPKGLILAATKLCLPANQVAMVGDQIFTDVLSGHRAGLFTVLVEPVNNTFIFKARRLVEAPFINKAKRRYSEFK